MTVQIDGCSFENNVTESTDGDVLGGTLHVDLSTIGGFLSIRNSRIASSQARARRSCEGSGAFVETMEGLLIEGTTFVDNVCDGGTADADAGPVQGGALKVDPESVLIRNSLFQGNRAQNVEGSVGSTNEPVRGGTIYSDPGGFLEIRDSTFLGNSAQTVDSPGDDANEASGGALYFTGSGDRKLVNVTSVDNVAQSGSSTFPTGAGGDVLGGAVALVNGSAAEILHGSFSGNWAQAGTGGAGGSDGTAAGGAIYVSATSTLVLGSTAFQDDEISVSGSTSTPQDCADEDGDGVTSIGYNIVPEPGTARCERSPTSQGSRPDSAHSTTTAAWNPWTTAPACPRWPCRRPAGPSTGAAAPPRSSWKMRGAP